MPVRLTICAFMTSPANAFLLFNQLLPNVPNLTSDSAVNRMKMHLLDKKLDQFVHGLLKLKFLLLQLCFI